MHNVAHAPGAERQSLAPTSLKRSNMNRLLSSSLLLSLFALAGCASPWGNAPVGCADTGCYDHLCDVPRELQKVSLPEYVVEPPDVLLIESVHHLRPQDGMLQPGDSLLVQADRTIPTLPDELPVLPNQDPTLQDTGTVSAKFKQIDGVYVIGTDGAIDLGPEYGLVPLSGIPISEARRVVFEHLRKTLKAPRVRVTLMQTESRQLVSGEHMVRPDGTVSLGVYGDVHVAGKTRPQVKLQIERQLARFIHRPEVSVDVLAYNSKFYYVVADGGGAGEQVHRFPSTGSETVLDAISQINGLPVVSSKKHIWVARPAPAGTGVDQVLPVDWNAIVQGGRSDTNYQIFPGDRIYVKADHLIATDTFISKLTSPFERMLGFALLGNGAVRSIQFGHRFGAGFGGGGFGGGGF